MKRWDTNQRYDFARLVDKLVRKLLIVVDQVVNVDIAVVSLEQRILPQLISVEMLTVARV